MTENKQKLKYSNLDMPFHFLFLFYPEEEGYMSQALWAWFSPSPPKIRKMMTMFIALDNSNARQLLWEGPYLT